MDKDNPKLLEILRDVLAKKLGKKPEEISEKELIDFIEVTLKSKSFGTILRDNKTVNNIATTFPTLTGDMLKDILVPTVFDGRDYWFDYLTPPAEMYDCGRGWLFAAVECLSSRYNIFTPNQRNVLLTSIEPIFCNLGNQEIIPMEEGDSSIVQKNCQVCTGSVYYALKYLYTHGAPMTSCVIYEDIFTMLNGKPACQFNGEEIYNECDNIFLNDRTTCPTSKKAMHRFRCSMFANVENNSETIMKEIYKNGPVVASYLVYEDFINEYTGKTIYRGPKKGSKFIGGHTGKIVGWGSENGVKYWIVSNSWSTEWGSGGYFKIERGSDVCKIESNVVTLYPDFPFNYSLFPQGLKISDNTLNNLRNSIKIDPYNYYEERVITLIKEGKIQGDLENFWNLQMIPNISTTNAGEIYAVPILYNPAKKDKINIVLVVGSSVIGILFGLLIGYLIYKIRGKNKK